MTNTQQQWINAEHEKPPKKPLNPERPTDPVVSVPVLCACRNGGEFLGECHLQMGEYYFDEEFPYWTNSYGDDFTPTHWMLPPELPIIYQKEKSA